MRLSNKLPPVAEAVGEETFGAAGGDFLAAKLVKLAKGDGFSAGLGGGEVVEVAGKLNPLNASVNPPIDDDDDCGAGEAISPNDGLRSCCGGAGGGFAYSDKIDCFRSGRDSPVALDGVEEVLVGRLVEGLVSPKKSSPSNESPGLFGFGAAGCWLGGGAARGVGSVVLGRTGGAISSPNRSIDGCCRCTAGWLAATR